MNVLKTIFIYILATLMTIFKLITFPFRWLFGKLFKKNK